MRFLNSNLACLHKKSPVSSGQGPIWSSFLYLIVSHQMHSRPQGIHILLPLACISHSPRSSKNVCLILWIQFPCSISKVLILVSRTTVPNNGESWVFAKSLPRQLWPLLSCCAPYAVLPLPPMARSYGWVFDTSWGWTRIDCECSKMGNSEHLGDGASTEHSNLAWLSWILDSFQSS